MDQVVVLARGLGTRMRKADPGAALDSTQAAAASAGVKAMIPIGRPFLDYVLSVCADAGYTRACLVIGPEHDQIREYYGQLQPRRISVEFAIQAEPRGTADAVASAETVVGDRPFLVINSDNYYPRDVLETLRTATGPGLAVFEQEALIAGGNIPAERVLKFALVQSGPGNCLKEILEKPDEATVAQLPRPLGVSMNCWRFGPAIFEACRCIPLSPRGELEITDAVQYSIDRLDQRYELFWCKAGVLDLSTRGDIESVAKRLAGVEVRL